MKKIILIVVVVIILIYAGVITKEGITKFKDVNNTKQSITNLTTKVNNTLTSVEQDIDTLIKVGSATKTEYNNLKNSLTTITNIAKEDKARIQNKLDKLSKLLKDESGKLCFTNKEYSKVTNPKAPVLSLPFRIEDYSTKYWGIVPFCAKLKHSGRMHGAFDFELKPDTKIYAAESGVINNIQVGKEEGSGEILGIQGDGFKLDYSGLKNIKVKVGDKVKKGDYIAQAVLIPHGEHHLHLGIVIDRQQECPIKYMDAEFKAAFKKMFAQAEYSSQTLSPCACNCETMETKW